MQEFMFSPCGEGYLCTTHYRTGPKIVDRHIGTVEDGDGPQALIWYSLETMPRRVT